MDREDVVDVNEVTVVGDCDNNCRFHLDPKSGLIGVVAAGAAVGVSLVISKLRKRKAEANTTNADTKVENTESVDDDPDTEEATDEEASKETK